jgi:hypothetical protein
MLHCTNIFLSASRVPIISREFSLIYRTFHSIAHGMIDGCARLSHPCQSAYNSIIVDLKLAFGRNRVDRESHNAQWNARLGFNGVSPRYPISKCRPWYLKLYAGLTNWHANSDCLQSLWSCSHNQTKSKYFTTSRHLNNWIRIEIGKREEEESWTHTHRERETSWSMYTCTIP